MRRLACALFAACFIVLPVALPGCGGTEDEVLEYDPEVSEQKGADYEKEMMEGMQKSGRPVPKK